MEAVVVGVDIGSSGVRAVAYDARYRIVASATRDLATTVGSDGESSQAWSAIAGAVQAALAELAATAAPHVVALAVSGTASSIAASSRSSDGRHRPVGEIMLWSDTRAASFQPSVTEEAARLGSFSRTLCPPHVSYWPAKLRWLREHAGRPTAERLHFGGTKDYVYEWLTGAWWTDPMTAAATGVFDSASWAWDAELLGSVSLDADRLPTVRAATDHAPLRSDVAATIGLPSGVPVVLGGMDGTLAQLGAAGFAPGIATCTIGTSLAYRSSTPARVVDPEQRLWCYPVSRDHWIVGGGGSNGGNVMTWLAHTLAPDEGVGDVLAAALAADSDPSLLFLPYLHGERSPLWRDDLRAAIIGLAAFHGPVDIARAALDGIGAEVLELAEAVRARVGPAAEIRLTGGFLRQPGWAQLVTDSLGVRTCVPDPPAATATGAALLAWMATGAPEPTPPPPARPTEWREPRPDTHARLRSKSDAWRRARAALFDC